MVCRNLGIIGAKRGSAFECRVDSYPRHLNLSQFEPTLRMCLRRFEDDEGWFLLNDLFPELANVSDGRTYIQRIRIELGCKEVVQNRRPRRYRLALTCKQIYIDERVWSLTEVDPRLLQRLRAAYQRFLF